MRVIVGNCVDCGEVVVVENRGGSWDLATCACGWRGGVDEIDGATVYAPGEAPRPVKS